MTPRLRAAGAAALVLLAALAAGDAAAQTPFALRNVGQHLETDDARMAARGFGMTVTDSLHPGFKNAASLATLRHVAVLFTGYGERGESKGDGVARKTSRTFTPEIRFALPVAKDRLALSGGFSVFRSSQYHTQTDLVAYAWGDTLRGNEQFVRDGSLFTVPLAASLRVVGGLAVAGTLNLVRGTLEESVGEFYTSPATGRGPLYQPSSRIDEERYDGEVWTVSGLWAPGRGRLRVGAAWTPGYDLRTQRKVELQGVARRATSEHVTHMPAEYRAGVQLGLGGRWLVGGDARYQDFGEYRGLVTAERDWAAAATEEIEYSFGLERVRGTERRRGWSNLPLRLSASFRQWGYEVGGAPVDQTTLSVGTGFPFRGNLGQLDVALSWSTIGNLERNGYETDLWRLTVSVVGLEEWW